ncbi:MAG: YicC family protein [Flavobacteriales bacterium]|nr:YicC family protein [Flavobacteriales bacterium]
MILSMTGYGKAEGTIGNKKFSIEIRSVNSKQFDLNVRMSGIYKEKEIPLRNKLSKKLVRGKMDLSIYFDSNGEDINHTINSNVVKNYYHQIERISSDLNLKTDDLLSTILKMPDAMKQEKKELDEDEWSEIEALIDEAVIRFNEFREQEGASLAADFQLRIDNIEKCAAAVVPFETERTQTVRDKIENHFDEYKDKDLIDSNRMEQEMIYYLEKLDITEERVRLDNHLKYFRETLEKGESQGKKLGFIGQEIGREINTMGSKANHSEIQKLVVQMKDELEKIKEQVLNAL